MRGLAWLLVVMLGVAACVHGSGPTSPAPPLGSAQRWDLFDPQAQVRGAPSREAAALRVRDVQPVDRSRGEPIRVRFNRAVAASDALPVASLIVEAQGDDARWEHVEGRTRWSGTDRVEFEPAEALPPAHRIRVRLEAALEGDLEVAWAFETPRPTVGVVEQYSDLGPREAILLWIDQRTSAASIREHVRVVGPAGRALPIDVREPDGEDASDGHDGPEDASWVELRPVRPWPRGVTLSVEVDGAFRSDAGVLPLGTAMVSSVDTRARFAFEGVGCEEQRGHTCPLGPISLKFSTVPEDVEGIEVVPEPDNLVISWGSEIVVDGDFVPGRRYEVVLPKGMVDYDEQTLSGRRRAWVRFSEVRAPGRAHLSLSDPAGIFATPQDAKVGLASHRVAEAEVRVAVLDPDDAVSVLETALDPKSPWPQGGHQYTTVLKLESGHRSRYARHVLDLGRHASLGDTVLVEARPSALAPRTTEDPEPVRGIYRISSLGVWSHQGPARGIVRVTEIASGLPREGVSVVLEQGETRRALGRSDRHGLVTLPGAIEVPAGAVLVAQAPGDALVTPLTPFVWNAKRRGICKMKASGRCHYSPGRARGGSIDPPKAPDPLRRGERGLVALGVGRAIYMPGDTIHIAGWAGISTPLGTHNTRRVPAGTPVALVLHERDREIAVGQAVVNAHGRFSKTLRVPEGAGLGHLRLTATMLGAEGSRWVTIAEPRIPTFEVHASVGDVPRGDSLVVRARANLLSGEPAPMRHLDADVHCSPGAPHMPRLPEGFSVRTDADIPSWSWRIHRELRDATSTQFEVPTEALGHRTGRLCQVSIAAADASRQPGGVDVSAHVHPGPGYLAISVPWDVEAGQQPVIEAQAVDWVGDAQPAQALQIQLARETKDEPVTLKTCRARRLKKGQRARCRAPKLAPGRYVVTVRATVQEHPLEVERHLWVFEPPKPRRSRPTKPREPEKPMLEVWAPDEAKAGERIDVEISGRWPSAQGVLTLEQTGLREAIPFTLKRGRATVSVVGREGAGTLLELTARVTRPAEGEHKARVETARGSVHLFDREQLSVLVTSPPRAKPGEPTFMHVMVRDDAGHPVDARLAIWVVDDALHALRAVARPHLAMVFNPLRPFEHAITDPHRELLDAFDPSKVVRQARVPRVRQAKGQVKGALDADVRQHFEPVPLFVGDIGTGPDGAVKLPVTLADDLTRFRISVLASAELETGKNTGPARFGFGEATVEVRAPLAVRAALPRALRPGDRAQLAGLVTVPADGTLAVQAAFGPALRLREPNTKIRRVRAGQVVRVPFAVEALRPGRPVAELTATLDPDVGEDIAGGVRRTLPITLERTAIERAAVYGSVATDRPVAIPLALPRAARGSVDVSITSTALGELQDASDYLVDYPYGCVEQTASRLIPLAALHGLGPRGPGADEQSADAIAQLLSMQLENGSFAYWPGGQSASPFGTAYAVWVLHVAREAGAVVPDKALEQASDALRRSVAAQLPTSRFLLDQALIERAFAARALAQTGAVPSQAVETLWSHRGRLPTFARLVLLQTLHRLDTDDPRIAVLMESLAAKIESRPGLAHVVDPAETSTWSWHGHAFSSPARTEAIALMTLLQVAPDDPRIEPLAHGLRARRRGGRWRNTQENAFALLALSQYAASAESAPPQHRVQAWIGPRRVLDARQEGFDQVPQGGAVGLASAMRAARGERTHVVVHREGKGRAYVRVGVEWTPEHAPARAQGLTLKRRIPTVLGVGAQARIELELSTQAPQHFVAVEVPLPAGLEAVDTSLGQGVAARVAPGSVTARALSHHELRPGRVLLFFDELPAGTTRHAIPVIATTPGEFAVPAAVAEAMYEPETRARTTPEVLVIRPRRE